MSQFRLRILFEHFDEKGAHCDSYDPFLFSFFFSFSQFRMFSDTSISNKLSVVNHFLTPATMCWESAIIEHAGKGGR